MGKIFCGRFLPVTLIQCQVINSYQILLLGEQGWHSDHLALTSHQYGPGLIPRPGIMWVEFFVGSLLSSERFFFGYSGLPLSLKINISKFQFDPGMHRHFWTSSCELLGAPWVNKLDSDFYIFGGIEKFHFEVRPKSFSKEL